jgi:hypothetical protein
LEKCVNLAIIVFKANKQTKSCENDLGALSSLTGRISRFFFL